MKKSTKIVAAMMIAALAVGSLSVYAAETNGRGGKWEHPAFSKRMGDFKGWGKNHNKGEKPQRQQLTEEEKAAKLETMKENCKKMLDKRLADGKITQEQYDEAIAKVEAGEFRFGFGFNGRNNAERSQRQELTEEEKAAKQEEMKAAQKKALDEQLAAGKITQEQYDEAIAKVEAGEFRFGFGFKGRNNAERSQRQELTEEEKAAKQEEMKAAQKKALDEQLAAGKITQEQYDEAIAKVEAGEFRFGFGFNGRPGGFRMGANRPMGHGFGQREKNR